MNTLRQALHDRIAKSDSWEAFRENEATEDELNTFLASKKHCTAKMGSDSHTVRRLVAMIAHVVEGTFEAFPSWYGKGLVVDYEWTNNLFYLFFNYVSVIRHLSIGDFDKPCYSSIFASTLSHGLAANLKDRRRFWIPHWFDPVFKERFVQHGWHTEYSAPMLETCVSFRSTAAAGWAEANADELVGDDEQPPTDEQIAWFQYKYLRFSHNNKVSLCQCCLRF